MKDDHDDNDDDEHYDANDDDDDYGHNDVDGDNYFIINYHRNCIKIGLSIKAEKGRGERSLKDSSEFINFYKIYIIYVPPTQVTYQTKIIYDLYFSFFLL